MIRLKFCFLLLTSLIVSAQEPMFTIIQTIENVAGNDLVLADFNKNGNIDLFISNGIWNTPLPSKLWLNDGRGLFTITTQDIGNAKSWCVQSADFNTDSYPDLFIVNGDWNIGDSSCIWLNDKGTGFRYLDTDFSINNSSAAAVGDLNNDNLTDIFIANHPYSNGEGGQDVIWFNDGQGSYIKSEQELPDMAPARRAKIADINGDSFLDIIVLNGDTNCIWINNGSGYFSEKRQNIGTGENIDLLATDIDNDQDIDIILAKGAWGKSPKGIEVWTNDSKGNFSKKQNIGNYDCYGLASADLNNDNFTDIILVNGTEQPNQIMLNDKQGRFYETNIEIGVSGNKVAVSDLNHDDLIDIVIVGNENTKIYIQTPK